MRSVPLSSAAGENALSVLWARERIGALMDQLRGGAPEAEIRDAVLKLALEHQLVSRYTSLVAVDKTPARSAEALLKSAALATNLPEGWVYEGVFGELPRGATSLRFDLLVGALLLLLAAAPVAPRQAPEACRRPGPGRRRAQPARTGRVDLCQGAARPAADRARLAARLGRRGRAPALAVGRYLAGGAARSAGAGRVALRAVGSSGRTLAFGPGHEQGTPAPGARGNSVIGGHRDTHLAFLERMTSGDSIRVQRADGVHVHYRVTQLDVLDKRDTWVTRNDGGTRLTLITCWPFDALRAGGDERYVVIAESDAVDPRSSRTSFTDGPSSLAPDREAQTPCEIEHRPVFRQHVAFHALQPARRASRMSALMMLEASPAPRHPSVIMTANSPVSRSTPLM